MNHFLMKTVMGSGMLGNPLLIPMMMGCGHLGHMRIELEYLGTGAIMMRHQKEGCRVRVALELNI